MARGEFTVTIEDEEGEIELTPPGKWEVCPRCHGEGAHCNPAIDGNGITSDEMAEAGPEFLEDYLNGLYDVRCSECGGRAVVWEIDWDRWQQSSPREAALYDAHLRAEALYRAEEAAERRMGA